MPKASAMTSIERLESAEAAAVFDELVDLLQDAVTSGASVGFLPPLDHDIAVQYWRAVLEELERGERILLVAREHNRVVGTIQLELPAKPNALHRAEVQKLLVHTNARR